jgi:hypothetical protein
MNANLQTLNSVASIVIFLAAIPALWISGRIILNNPVGNRSTRMFFWLVLGGFFLIPLIDLITLIRDLISLAFPSEQIVTDFPLFLGNISWPLFLIIATAMNIIVYAFAIFYGRRILEKRELPFMKELTLNNLESGFVVLGFAGLLNQMIGGIVMNFIWMQIPVSTTVSSQGLFGSLVGWIVAFLILAVLIIFMNGKLESGEE